MDHFGPKIVHRHNSGFTVVFFKKILHNEKGQQVDESNDNGLYQKFFVEDKWAILVAKMVLILLTLRFFKKILQNERD